MTNVVKRAIAPTPAGFGDIAAAQRILETSGRGRELEGAIAALLRLLDRFPESEDVQVICAKAFEKTRDPARAPAVWTALCARFPRSHEAFRMRVGWIARAGGDAAARFLRARFPRMPVTYDGLMLYARGHDEARQPAEADRAYEILLSLFPQVAEPYRHYAMSLKQRGELARADEVLRRAEQELGAAADIMALAASVRGDLNELGRIQGASGERLAAGPSSIMVLERILRQVASRRASAPNQPRGFIGPVVMITGSLGPGGAERQFTNTALELQRAIVSGYPVAGRDIVGPITVCCRSLRARKAGDFFLGDISSAGISVSEYTGFEPYGGRSRNSSVRPFRESLRFLPPQMAEGTERLTDTLRYLAPDIVHIWQDGSILATALAALIAEAPRIVLGVRTLPPIDRPDRAKPQYETLYKSLLAMPGVSLTANSIFAARRYAEWLDVDPALIPVIYNGVDLPVTNGDAAAQSLFAEFDARTADARFTLGSVIRIDENKRPYLWLETAAAILRRHPESRFILVGEGPLLEAAREYAARLGIAARVLFVGRSASVGYWLSKFDAFLLLSRFEGLPNALIEAQRCGVPVFTTAAGGAAETVREGVTGHVFADSANPLASGLAAWISAWVETTRENPSARAQMSDAARAWARESFGSASMMERLVRIYALP